MKSFVANIRLEFISIIHIIFGLLLCFFIHPVVVYVLFVASLLFFWNLANVNISHYFCINRGMLSKRTNSFKLLCTVPSKEFISIVQADLINNAIPRGLELIRPGHTLSVETHLLPSNEQERLELIEKLGVSYELIEKHFLKTITTRMAAWVSWKYKLYCGIEDSQPDIMNKQWYRLTIIKE